MYSLLSALPLICGVSAATVRRQVDNTQPVGNNPVSVAKVEYLGEQLSSNSCTHRDLGFAGQFGGSWWGVYGDTLYCSEGVTNPDEDTEGFHGMVRDAVAKLGDDPLKIEWAALNEDKPVAHPTQFIPFNEAWGETGQTGFGGTSICEVDESTAIVFYLINNNEAGLGGAGIARVEMQNGAPVVTERMGENGFWWDTSKNPRYGDVAAFKDRNSDYIYAWGGAPTSVSDSIANQYVYQVRVRASDAFDLNKYEYWWGRERGWEVGEPLTEFTSETAVMWGVGQGQTVYSPYYKTYMYVHFAGAEIAVRTAPKPDGPWSDAVGFYTPKAYEGGMVYAGLAYPYLDESGKTLTVGWTNSNHIQILKVTFDSL